eukprot:scaffold12839_cov125-Isochrysis_galbana.AAC.1
MGATGYPPPPGKKRVPCMPPLAPREPMDSRAAVGKHSAQAQERRRRLGGSCRGAVAEARVYRGAGASAD